MKKVVKDTNFFINTPFACNTVCILLGTDSRRFWIIRCGILYRSSWRTPLVAGEMMEERIYFSPYCLKLT